MVTDYPWSGAVELRVTSAPPAACGLALRVPAWASAPSLLLNGQPLAADPATPGNLVLHRQWRPGDVLSYQLPVALRLSYPSRRVDAVHGMAAIERGPLVYCFEQADQPAGTDLEDLALTGGELRERTAELPGVGRTVLIEAAAVDLPPANGQDLPYHQAAEGGAAGEPGTATALPYFQWDNRDGRPMRVWLPTT
jgi:DUF1680 family protein